MPIGEDIGDAEIKLKKGRHLLVAIFCALVVPMLVTAFAINYLKQDYENEIIRTESSQKAKVLARGLSVPVWNLDSKAGSNLISTLTEDPSIVAVRVRSLAQGEFLEYENSLPINRKIVSRFLRILSTKIKRSVR